jgi:hypothetical protein
VSLGWYRTQATSLVVAAVALATLLFRTVLALCPGDAAAVVIAYRSG